MSELLKKIKKQSLQFRKDRNSVGSNLLTTVIGDIEQRSKIVDGEKVVTDTDSLSVIKKFLKTTEFNIDNSVGDQKEAFGVEKDILDAFMPQMMGADELKNIVETFVSETDNANIGSVMKFLKENHAGLYDGKQASMIVKEVL